MQNTSNSLNLKPDKFERGAPLYAEAKVNVMTASLLIGNDSANIHGRAKLMVSDLEKATDVADQANSHFGIKIRELCETQHKFVEESKKASGAVRDATQKLADGLSKIEKTANFDRLERYVSLLERSVSALTVLAELDKAGKLERIAQALK